MTDSAAPGWTHLLTSDAELREYYRDPSPVVQQKSIDHLDDHCRNFITRSTFVMVGTADGTKQDVSPKGGPAGFVKVLDDRRLAIPDLNGNNRIDGLRDLIRVPQVGLMFIIPGMGETLRVNGDACVTTDPAVLDLFTDDVRRPKAAIGVTVRSSFLHCAKAFMRAGMWAPESWPAEDARPSAGAILVAHAELSEMSGRDLDQRLAAGYVEGLEQDQPHRPPT